MDWVTITGVKPWDGRYELDPEADFTTREWGWIKRLSGYLPLTIDGGFEGADPELIATFAVIALYRADKVEERDIPDLFERFKDAPFPAGIRYEGGEALLVGQELGHQRLLLARLLLGALRLHALGDVSHEHEQPYVRARAIYLAVREL